MDKEKDCECMEEFDPKKLLGKLCNYYEIGRQYYGRIHKKMQLLNSTDNGDLWKAIRAKFPPYQLLPDTNAVAYVKSNILASLYTVAKSAQIVPTCEEDVEISEVLNVALEHDWDKNDVGYYQFLAGERAALLNLGLTQVYWDESKQQVAYKNIDPIHFMRDPFADNLQNGGWCEVHNTYHRSVFKNNPLYREAFMNAFKDRNIASSSEMPPDYNERNHVGNSDEHYTLFVWWVRNPEGGIDEFHTIDNTVLLHYKQNIQPEMYPFAELYCNLPGSGLVGSSEPAKIFANNLVYNLMDSIAYTSVYKNQRPPKFISSQSGLNLQAFTKHGNEADRTFIVNGDASKAVHYHQFPDVSAALPNMQNTMMNNIQNMSGVDGRYTGRDTGSIITTGGTEEMLNRVTLIDTPKVMNYEKYTRRLTELTLKLMLQFAPKRKYIIKDEVNSTPTTIKYKTVEIDFPIIDADAVFEYSIQISSELPKNKQRIQAWANNMMEKQMQYQQQGVSIDVITPEEWIRCQDVPYKEQMLQRMGIQSSLNAYLEAQNVVSEYAAMLEAGALPEDAMAMAADGLQSMRQGEPTPLQQQGVDTSQPTADATQILQ